MTTFARAVFTAFCATALCRAGKGSETPPRLHAGAEPYIAPVDASAFKNANGSPRLSADAYTWLRAHVAPRLMEWARDARLRIDPGFVLAIVIKESAGDSLAVSSSAAIGLAQLTATADSDLRVMAATPDFAWMSREMADWPRDARLRGDSATAARCASLIRSGNVDVRREYRLDPKRSTRAAVFWLRLLEKKWTADQWPGGYGTFARARLNDGAPLSESQLLDLVTASYNRGYLEVHALVDRYGRGWTEHLSELTGERAEVADYLERVRAYATILQTAPR